MTVSRHAGKFGSFFLLALSVVVNVNRFFEYKVKVSVGIERRSFRQRFIVRLSKSQVKKVTI